MRPGSTASGSGWPQAAQRSWESSTRARRRRGKFTPESLVIPDKFRPGSGWRAQGEVKCWNGGLLWRCGWGLSSYDSDGNRVGVDSIQLRLFGSSHCCWFPDPDSVFAGMIEIVVVADSGLLFHAFPRIAFAPS